MDKETESDIRIVIRKEQPKDYREVENLTREAFWNVYRPGCTEHYVLNQYRNNPDFIPELDFVMEMEGKIIGHCFNEKGFSMLWGDYFPSNPASGRVMEKCGFIDTGEETVCPNLEVGSDCSVRVMKLERNMVA